MAKIDKLTKFRAAGPVDAKSRGEVRPATRPEATAAKTKNLIVRVTPELHQEFRVAALKAGRSGQQILEDYIETFVREHGAK